MKQSEVEKKYQAYDYWSAGKGSHYRPVDKKKYDENYDRIFKVRPVRNNPAGEKG